MANKKSGKGLKTSTYLIITAVSIFMTLLFSACRIGGGGTTPAVQANTPESGRQLLYHAVFPGGTDREEDEVALSELRSYEKAVGKTAAWVYFSHNWFNGRSFPLENATWIRKTGAIPYVRLMLWSSSGHKRRADPAYSHDRIISGEFDDDFKAWARAAKQFGSPLIAEFGVEVNGRWFPWNGWWNGRGETSAYGDPDYPDGPERFRDAYRRIIDIMNKEGASNITWVFHIDREDNPEEDWNRFEYYYPGDDYIDWIGISVYGPPTPMEDEILEFREMLDPVYKRIKAMSPAKPVAILEFGCAKNNPRMDQADWAERALTNLTSGRWPGLIGFCWWNEAWRNDDQRKNDTTMRVQDNPALGRVFQRLVGNNSRVLGRMKDPKNPAQID